MNQSTTFYPAVEYKEIYYDFRKSFGQYPRIKGNWISDDHVWQKSQELAFKLIRSDLKDGWEVDQSAWGTSCFKHKQLKIGMSSWDAGQWIAYFLLGMVTMGIGLFVLPFLMGNTFIELQGVEVRLRRAQRS